MKVLYLLYFVLTFCTGIVSLGITIFLYTDTKARLLRSYLYVYSAFTLVVLLDTSFAFRLKLALSPETLYALDAVLAVSLLVWICTGLAFARTLVQESPGKEVVNKLLALVGIGLPGFLADRLLFEPAANFRLFPLLYCGVSVALTHHFLKCAPSPPPVQPFHDVPQGSATGFDETALLERYNISPREQDIVRLIVQGYSNQQIAEHLSVTVSTIKKHITSVYYKMDIKSRDELIARFKTMTSDSS